jgi:uncharacterized membrane protein YkvA (DUF1232 family)
MSLPGREERQVIERWEGGGSRWRGLKRVLDQAKQLIRNPRELLGILDAAERRLDRLSPGPFATVVDDVKTLLRLVRSYATGDYRDVSARNLALAVAAVVYLVSPLDVIPDFLPFGFTDDAAVVGFVLGKIGTELVRFRAWEQAQGVAEA